MGLSMVTGMRDESIAWSDLAITVSGTVTLDIMRQCQPMIGVYKASILSCIGAKVLLRTRYKLLPNIIADDEIVPEYVPWCRGAGPIIAKAQWLLDDSRRTASHQQGLRRALGTYKGHDFAGECAKVNCRDSQRLVLARVPDVNHPGPSHSYSQMVNGVKPNHAG